MLQSKNKSYFLLFSSLFYFTCLKKFYLYIKWMHSYAYNLLKRELQNTYSLTSPQAD